MKRYCKIRGQNYLIGRRVDRRPAPRVRKIQIVEPRLAIGSVSLDIDSKIQAAAVHIFADPGANRHPVSGSLSGRHTAPESTSSKFGQEPPKNEENKGDVYVSAKLAKTRGASK